MAHTLDTSLPSVMNHYYYLIILLPLMSDWHLVSQYCIAAKINIVMMRV